ncbi:hypothetical protein MKX03_022144 [Papaver bracteatum]|nr:hypothetical protein MKX03_022144 [Papaver bracteatum]
MKIVSFIFILLIQFSSFFFVNSQADSCGSDNNLTLKGVPFDTTILTCFHLWTSHDYILRTGSDEWNFLLSAPSTNINYIAIGFSTTQNCWQMIGSSAMVGWIGNNNIVFPDQGNLTLVDKSSPVIISQNSRLYIAFQLKTVQPIRNVVYSIGLDGVLPNSRFQLTQHAGQGSTIINYRGEAEEPTPEAAEPMSSSSSRQLPKAIYQIYKFYFILFSVLILASNSTVLGFLIKKMGLFLVYTHLIMCL